MEADDGAAKEFDSGCKFQTGPVKAALDSFDPSKQKYYKEAEEGAWQTYYDLLPDETTPFIHSADGRKPLPFSELKKFITGPVCQIEGLGREDRLCTAIQNGPEAAVAFFAFAIRCTFAPLNLGLSRAEFEFEYVDLPCACLIVQDQESQTDDDKQASGAAIAVARKCKVPRMFVLTPDKKVAGLFTLGKHPAMRGAKPGPVDKEPHLSAKREQLALVLHTSGTTKKPKIVPLTHANICIGAQCIASTVQQGPEDLCINVMPLFHIHGLIVNILSSAVCGSQVLCMAGMFNQAKFWQSSVSKPTPTWYSAVPTMHSMILSHAKETIEVLKKPLNHKLGLIRNCSAALVPTVACAMEDLFKASIMPTYAMTESMPICSNPRYGARKLRSVGPRGGPLMAVMHGDKPEFMPMGEEGEICVRNGPVTAGYEFRDHMDCDPNIEAIAHREGYKDETDGPWLRTGDKGWLDEEGYLYLSGRFKEIINRGGEKISPFEIEDVMRQHPAVQDLIAFAAPHETLGECVGVAMVLKEGMETNIKEMRSWVTSGGLLQNKWLPEVAVKFPVIPKGPTGKPARIGLAKRIDLPMLGSGPPMDVNYDKVLTGAR